jgi:hypothetical protein
MVYLRPLTYTGKCGLLLRDRYEGSECPLFGQLNKHHPLSEHEKYCGLQNLALSYSRRVLVFGKAKQVVLPIEFRWSRPYLG